MFAVVAGYHDDARQVFEVDLVHDAAVGWHDAEVPERALAPAQKLVALAIALEFADRVDAKRLLAAEAVDLDRVIDDEICGRERIDA